MIPAVHILPTLDPLAALAGAGFLPLAVGLWGIIWGLLATLLVLVCLLLMAIVLIQDPKGGGLASAFGASGGGDSIIGARAQKDVNVWTGTLAGVFIVLVFSMVMISNRLIPKSTGSSIQGAQQPPAGATGAGETGAGKAGEGAGPKLDFSLPPAQEPTLPEQPAPGPKEGTGTPGGAGVPPPSPAGDGGAAPKE